MRVALDLHPPHELDAADLGDAPHVVAPEVDEHHVLGALLGIGQKLALERRVFLQRLAARPRAGQRPHRHHAVLEAHHRLGARPHDLLARRLPGRGRQIEEVHVGRRVDDTHRAVRVEGIATTPRHAEPPREDDLEGVPRGDVLLRAPDVGLEARVVQGDRHVRRDARAVGESDAAEGGGGGEIGVRAVDVLFALGGDGHGLREGVEHHERRAADEAGEGGGAGRGPAGDLLDGVHEVPGEVPEVRARELRRGVRGERARVGRAEERLGGGERVALLPQAPPERDVRVPADRPSVRAEDGLVARPVPEDRVTPPPVTRHDALEKKGSAVRIGLPERGVGGDRGEPVGHEGPRGDACRRHAPFLGLMPRSVRARSGSTGVRPIERAYVAARAPCGALPSASTPFDR